MKKRGADTLHWDASYKEPKHLCQHHGKAIFRALFTATNQLGEIRLQFHVVTDGHDQVTPESTTHKTNTGPGSLPICSGRVAPPPGISYGPFLPIDRWLLSGTLSPTQTL